MDFAGNFIKSLHATHRTSQRGIADRMIKVLQENVPPHFHRGKMVFLAQDKYIKSMLDKGCINPTEAGLLRGLAVFTGPDGGLITAYFPSSRKWKVLMRCPTFSMTRKGAASSVESLEGKYQRQFQRELKGEIYE